MLKSYFVIAFRNITRHKLFSIINVLGLALGMTCCLFIFLWVDDEKRVDDFHANNEHIFALYQNVEGNGKIESNYSSPVKYTENGNIFLLENIRELVPEIKLESYYSTGYELPWGHPETFQVNEKILKLEGSRAGKDFFKIFSFPILAGRAETALSELHGIAISRKMAALFFESPTEAVGKSIRFENRENFKVSAVFEDLPANSSLKFDYLFSWEAQKKLMEFATPEIRVFVQLSKTGNAASATKKLNQIIKSQLPEDIGKVTSVGLQKFSDQYLFNHFENGKPVGGRIEYVKIFSGIAIFILLIACVNFMNLSTARSVKRAKEIGLRKVVGSTRAGLVFQFFGESLLFSLIAMAFSIFLLIIFLPLFNYSTQKNIELPFTRAAFWTWLMILVSSTAIIAGSYPAFYLSSLAPVSVLKGLLKFPKDAILFRKSLTVFQFTLSTTLLIATIVITRQTNYIQKKHLGYDKENLVVIRIEGELSNKDKYLHFKQRAMEMPGIAMVDRSSELLHKMNFVVTDPINWEGKEPNSSIGFKPASVGMDFIPLMKMEMAEGRGFSNQYPTDSTDAFMVNEEAVRQMGIKDPIGKWVSAWSKKGHIIGVLKDFHTSSLHEPIKPVIIDVKEYEYFGVIMARLKNSNTVETIAQLEKLYKNINPNFAFDWQFVDQEYQNLYSNEKTISQLSILFSTLAIFISCLGLVGLVMFAAEQRMKEISIRKVLGATVRQIYLLFSKDFLQLSAIAFVIAVPVSWLCMNYWLQSFSYKTAMDWWIFVLAGMVSLFMVIAIVAYQTRKANIVNPAKILRND